MKMLTVKKDCGENRFKTKFRKQPNGVVKIRMLGAPFNAINMKNVI